MEGRKMETVLLFVTAASALCAASSLPAHKYVFVYEMKNWTEAQSYCRQTYTDLATVEDMEDVQMLNNAADLKQMTNSNNYVAWIGLYDDVKSWRWSMSDPNFYQGDETFRSWAAGEPNNFNAPEGCVEISFAGIWYDTSCYKTIRPICFDVSGLNATFFYIDIQMNWTDGQNYCRQHHTDLASVRNPSENQMVEQMLPSGYTAWIGLYRDTWKWSDGNNSTFKFWNSSQPVGGTKNCASADLRNGGQWEEWSCDQKNYFVCYGVTESKQVVKLKLVSSSSVNLNDTVVQENLLKQLQQKLQNQGVHGDLRLSWRKQTDGQVFHEDED